MDNPQTLLSRASPLSAGQMIRAAREAKGVQLTTLSSILKVSVGQLEDLEADAYDRFKELSFARALANTVCRHLALDAQPVLAGMPQGSARASIVPTSIDKAPKTSVSVVQGRRSKGLSVSLLLLAVLMLCISALLIWWPGLSSYSPFGADAVPDLDKVMVFALPAV